MKQTAVEWLVEELEKHHTKIDIKNTVAFNQAKAMEKWQKLKHQLFIGKVSDIIGFEKTVELLKECNNITGGNK
jgi:hypothetical protein